MNNILTRSPTARLPVLVTLMLDGRRIPTPSRTVVEQEDLYTIHHPFAQPLTIARQFCKATEHPIDGDFFHHICDTQESSSGAPVLDTQFHLVGIHTAGGKSERPGTFNVGLLLSKVLDVSPTVAHALSTYGESSRFENSPSSQGGGGSVTEWSLLRKRTDAILHCAIAGVRVRWGAFL